MNNVLNNLIQAFGGIQNFANTVNQTEQTFKSQGISAEERAREMVNSGKSTPQQLQLAMKLADQICPRR